MFQDSRIFTQIQRSHRLYESSKPLISSGFEGWAALPWVTRPWNSIISLQPHAPRVNRRLIITHQPQLQILFTSLPNHSNPRHISRRLSTSTFPPFSTQLNFRLAHHRTTSQSIFIQSNILPIVSDILQLKKLDSPHHLYRSSPYRFIKQESKRSPTWTSLYSIRFTPHKLTLPGRTSQWPAFPSFPGLLASSLRLALSSCSSSVSWIVELRVQPHPGLRSPDLRFPRLLRESKATLNLEPPTTVTTRPPRARQLVINLAYHHLRIVDEADTHLLYHAAIPPYRELQQALPMMQFYFEETHYRFEGWVDVSQVAFDLVQEVDEGQNTRQITIELVNWKSPTYKIMNWWKS